MQRLILQNLLFTMEFRSLLSVILLCNSLCVRSYIHKTAAHSHVEANAQRLPQTLRGKTSPLRVRPVSPLHSYPGQTLELQCTAEDHEVLAHWWQTPFGSFQGCDHRNKDPVETCNGSLRISKVTSSHDGLYFCIRQDETGRTILPYRVNVVGLNPDIKEHLRKTEVNVNTMSDSHFVAAVTSSVIVTFFVAFTLGACSRSYVIKCLQVTRGRMPHRKGKHDLTDGNDDSQPNTNTQPPQFETVLFHKDQDTGEGTVDMVGCQVNRDLVDQETESVGDAHATGNEIAEGEKDVSNQLQSHDDQNQEFKSVLSPHPKKRSRVIKVYNYDEEGNPYSHIKDSGVSGEDEVRPKLRTKSLTRLNAIMKQAESTDFNPVQESTESQSA